MTRPPPWKSPTSTRGHPGSEGTAWSSSGYVRFTPGARTNWHSHALGQTLHCTDGIGLVVTRDGTTWLEPVPDDQYQTVNKN